VILAHQHGALVVSPDKQVLWSYTCPAGTEVHTIQALGLDQVMIFSNGNPAQVMTFDIKSGELKKSFPVTVGNPRSVHGQVRHTRITPAGTLLIAHMDSKEVNEYTMDGGKIWSVKLNGAWAAVRLKNGNTLVSTQKTHVVELDKSGKVVWELAPEDIPQVPLHNVQEVGRLDNGNTVLTNWIPNSAKAPQWPGTAQVVEVTPEKKVVWVLSQWSDPDLGPATCIQLLDQSGTPEEHTMQR
jgi:outer membrane protein assembly factor BamB